MSALDEWARRWNIPDRAIDELCATAMHINVGRDDESEGRIQSMVRLAAARSGRYLFRNNSGAFKDETGRLVRYGLGNDSKKLNEHFKSADLIGWEAITIQHEHVGQRIARFLSVEVKRGDWKFSGSLAEMAQSAWAVLVNAQGGRAIITNTPDSI